MTRITTKLFLPVFFLVFQHLAGMETSPYFFTQIGVEDGLSQGSVSHIYQDTDGFLWLGTRGGLHRYDGYEFTVYKNNPTDSCSLTDNNILDIGEDRNKNIWVITDHGIHKITRQTGNIKRYRVKETRFMHCCMLSRNGDFLMGGEKFLYQYDEQGDSLVYKDWLSSTPIASNIKSIQEDDEGNLYIASTLAGMAVLNKEREVVHYFQHDPDDPSSLVKGAIRRMFTDSSKRLWILSETSGICYLDKKNNKFVHLNTANSKLSSNVVRAIAEPVPGTLLLGTFSGLNKVDGQTLEVTPYKFNPDEPGALSYYSVHSLLKDNTGALWAGTWKGLNYYSPARKQFYQITPNEFTGLLGKGEEDDEGNIWFATEGAGLFCYNPQTQSQQFYPKKSPYKSNYSSNIFKSLLIKGDSIICATNQGAVYLFSRKRKDYRLLYDFQRGDIYTLLNDSKGRLWIPTNSSTGLVMIENGKQINQFPVDGTTKKFYFVTTIKEVEPDVFVMGTLGQGIYKYDMKKETLKTVSSPELNLPDNIKPGIVSGIQTDSMQNIWVSFYGNSIFRFDKELNLVKQYTGKEGITDGYIYTMVYDRNQLLWVLSGNDLYCFDPAEDRFSPVWNDSQLVLEPTIHAGTTDKQGILYFPGNKGILCFNPSQMNKNTYIPPVYLTTLSINNNPVEFKNTQPLRLKANETNIAIGYTAPDFISPKQNQYAYRMEGVEKEWNHVRGRRVAYYSNLAPGTYNFKVKVANSENLWNPQEASMSIIVSPPPFKTWWAYTLYIIIIGTIIWRFIYHQKVRHELESSIRFKQLEQEKMKELHEERMRLFTNFSHELRTPLTLITNPLEDMLRHSSFSMEVKNTLQLMRKNTQRLLLLVNNLMDVQKYDSQKMVLQKEKFDLTVFINELYELFAPVARNRNISFTLKNDLPTDFCVYYDRQEIEKVMFNLLSNAFKFTSEGGTIEMKLSALSNENDIVRVKLWQNRDLSEDYYLHIQVSDNGEGIASEDIEKIFEPFYRSSQDLHHQIAGSGIGLSLARFIVEQHGGIIWAENMPQAGTRMHVLLPLPQKPVSNPVKHTEPSLLVNTQEFLPSDKKEIPIISQTLLIVEDNKDVLEYLEKQFENEYKVQKAENGQEALKQIAIKVPDLIISDIMMPEMDGLELCRQVKQNQKLSHIPVILLTAKTMPSQITEGYNVGADDYIIKPFDIVQLQARVRNLLASRKQIRKKYEKKIDLNELGVKTSPLDEEFLKQYTAIVKANFSNPDLDVDMICKEIGMSRANFYRKAKTLTALSPAEMIKNLRLEAAAQMLRETDLNVSEILEKVAFSSSGYFASCFKQVYGLSPKEYRKVNSNGNTDS
ncbi:hypothetical protein HMPREF1212_03216 [Parabacteroides sp. HGS0025]|uniref:hybrid sensor histidine kinase/response regulator transcription factor n=1 Tax=Parabacteroides sp. HGS0025 TaxID=1078087 RepID=UPI0006177806|nr:response regulator [Parabacteroides sp. HGS0025]KKB50056.1 hypothetical protein HMPREF1212_03216 [Parabacteroides sp. HGS0025]